MKPVDNVPGVTFHVEHAERTSVLGKVLLHCDVHDGDVWDKALEKLNGYRLYTVQQLHEAVTSLIQQEAEEEKARLEEMNRLLKVENEQLKQRNSVLEQSNGQLIHANAEWARWHGEDT